MKITKPGVYDDLTDVDYHAQHDWLSVSGAKKLLPPSCPAKYKATLGDEEHRQTFDLGKAAHTRILGAGADLVVVDAATWQTKAAREQRDAAYAAGRIPVLAHEADLVEAMAMSVRRNPDAAWLFAEGRPEVSLFWVDEATGVKCRARLDWLRPGADGRRTLVGDLKTAASAEPGEFSRASARLHYPMQDRWYLDGVRALGLGDDPAFVFVAVEKDKPYITQVSQLQEADDLHLATGLNDKARRIYAECLATDQWPTYHPGVAPLRLPAYYHYAYEGLLA